MSVVEDLEAARELIKRGWCQKEAERTVNGQKQYCAMMAVEMVSGTGADYYAVREILQRAVPIPSMSVIMYNDSPGRTQEEMVDLFTRAIALYEEDAA